MQFHEAPKASEAKKTLKKLTQLPHKTAAFYPSERFAAWPRRGCNGGIKVGLEDGEQVRRSGLFTTPQTRDEVAEGARADAQRLCGHGDVGASVRDASRTCRGAGWGIP